MDYVIHQVPVSDAKKEKIKDSKKRIFRKSLSRNKRC
jgi:hypothetical protein